MRQEIDFLVEGLRVAGDLFVPDDLKPDEQRPALLLAQGFGDVKEGLETPALAFAAAGYVVLRIDYRSFGVSDGEPRCQLFPVRMIEDLRSGLSFLETRPEVDRGRIGLWGTSFGGAMVLATGAVDRRARVVIAQVPVVNGRAWMRGLRTAEQWETMLELLEADRRRRFAGEPGERAPSSLQPSDGFSVMPCDRTVTEWRKTRKVAASYRWDMMLESLEKIIEFNPSAIIGQIGPRPLLMIAGTGFDILHPMDQILEAFRRASEPKQIVFMPYSQLGLYSEPGVSEALDVALAFLGTHLPVDGRRPA